MADLTDEERQQITDYLSHPILFPHEFKSWISDYVSMNIPKITVNQILGFELWQIKSAPEITATELCTSTSYTNLATVGPEINNLSPGFYIVIWGGNTPYTGNSNNVTMGVSINGAAPTSSAEIISDAGAFGGAALLDLTQVAAPITLTAKYKCELTTGRNIRYRWMHALRVVT